MTSQTCSKIVSKRMKKKTPATGPVIKLSGPPFRRHLKLIIFGRAVTGTWFQLYLRHNAEFHIGQVTLLGEVLFFSSWILRDRNHTLNNFV